MAILSQLNRFDIFGTQVGLNFQRDHGFKTSFGGVVSVVFVAFIGIFFWNTLLQFVRKENVTSTISKIYSEDPDSSILNSQTFMFAVKINQDDFITRPYFNITFETREYVTSPNGTKQRLKKPVALEACTVDHWKDLPSYGKNWTQMFHQFGLNQFLCPRINDTFVLSGRYNSESFNHWKFSVRKCRDDYPEDSLWQPTCASEQEIDDYYKKNTNARFLFYFNNFILDPIKSENYVETFIEDTLFFSIQREGAYQTADIYLTENKQLTDQSLLPFKQIEQENYITFQTNNFRGQYVIGPIQDAYADFFILKDPYSYQIKRWYQKVTEILSYIGGFAQIFILISALIVKNYNDFECAITFANKIYDFEKQENQNQQIKRVQERKKYQTQKTQRKSIQKQAIQQISKEQNYNENQNKISDTQKKNEQVNLQKEESCDVPISLLQIKSLQFQESHNKNSFHNIMSKFTVTPRNISNRNQNSPNQIQMINKNDQMHQQNSSTFNQQIKDLNKTCKIPQNNANQDSKIKNDNLQEDYQFNIKQQNQINQEEQNILNKEECNHMDTGIQNEIQLNSGHNKVKSSEDIKNSFGKQNLRNQVKYNTSNDRNQQIDSQVKSTEQNISNIQVQDEYNINQSQNSKNEKYSTKEEINFKEVKNELIIIPNENKVTNNLMNNVNQEVQTEKQDEGENTNRVPYSVRSNSQKDQFSSLCKFKIKSKNNLNESIEPESPKQISHDEQLKQEEQSQNQKFNNLLQINIDLNQVKEDITNEKVNMSKFNRNQSESNKSSSSNQQQFLNKEFEYLLKRDASIKLSIKYFLYKLTCQKLFRSEKTQLIERAINQMKKDLDIFVIVNKLKEIEKIKGLLLDKDQEILFNFFPKPVLSAKYQEETLTRTEIVNNYRDRNNKQLSLNNSNVFVSSKSLKSLNMDIKTAQTVSLAAAKFKRSIKDKTISFTSIKAYEKLFNAFQNINKREYSLFNKRLIELLGDEINSIFKISNNIANRKCNQNFDSQQNETDSYFFEQQKLDNKQAQNMRAGEHKCKVQNKQIENKIQCNNINPIIKQQEIIQIEKVNKDKHEQQNNEQKKKQILNQEELIEIEFNNSLSSHSSKEQH